MRQAAHTASFYMAEAVDAIDHSFGAGYAKSNPALVAAFMHVAGADYNNWNDAESAKRVRESIDTSVDAICLKIEDAIELANFAINIKE